MTHRSGRHFLQIPGPTNVPERILRAMDFPTIDHRGPAFGAMAREVLHGLKGIFRTESPVVMSSHCFSSFPASDSRAGSPVSQGVKWFSTRFAPSAPVGGTWGRSMQ